MHLLSAIAAAACLIAAGPAAPTAGSRWLALHLRGGRGGSSHLPSGGGPEDAVDAAMQCALRASSSASTSSVGASLSELPEGTAEAFEGDAAPRPHVLPHASDQGATHDWGSAVAQVRREGAVCAGRSGRMGEVVPNSPPLCVPQSFRHLREGISAAETKRFAGSCYRDGGRGEADLDSEEGAWRCRMEERDAVRRAYFWESVEEDSNATIFNIFSRQDKQHGACDEYVEPVPWEESYDSASADSQHSDCEKEKKAGEGLASVHATGRTPMPTGAGGGGGAPRAREEEGDREEDEEESLAELSRRALQDGDEDESQQGGGEEPWERDFETEDRVKYAWEAVFEAFQGTLDVGEQHRARADPIDVALWQSASEGNAIQVEQWLLQGADANHRAGATQTLPVLHLAASLGHSEVVRALLRGGASVDAVDGEGWSALHMAADRGHLDTVVVLAHAGADVNQRIIIVPASFSADLAAEEHGDGDSPDMEEGEGALHWLANSEDDAAAARMVDCLCDLGAQVDLATSKNRTALHWAVDSNNVAVAQRLVARGADVNAPTGFLGEAWYIPLTWAARQGNEGMVKMLVEMGADVFARGQDERTALWWAEQNCFEDIADWLRKFGIADRAPIPEVVFGDDVEEFASASYRCPP